MFGFFKKHRISTFFLIFFAVEILSFFGFLYPQAGMAFFWIAAVIVLLVSLFRIEYGLLIVLAELLIGSKGYLFALDFDGTSVSIRLALFLVVMGVWIAGFIIKKQYRGFWTRIPFLKWYALIFLALALGCVQALVLGNNFSNLFFDLNGYLYFALLFPLADVFRKTETWKRLGEIAVAAITWVSIKTFLVFFVFAHGLWFYMPSVYTWIRTTGVGEIVKVDGNFYRVFFQGHVYQLIALIILLGIAGYAVSGQGQPARRQKFFWFMLILMMSVVLLSLSRSFWVGLAVGIITLLGIMRYRFGAPAYGYVKFFGITAGVAGASIIFLFALMNIPPTKGDLLSPASLISERATTQEAAGQSRLELLKPLWSSVLKHPFLGSGFGSTVTYHTKDPRALQNNPTGEYTTFAFEWGYLDIWYKMGLLGLIAFGGLLGSICWSLWQAMRKTGSSALFEFDNRAMAAGIFASIMALAAVHFFTPYITHPLGIGFILLSSIFITIINKTTVQNKS